MYYLTLDVKISTGIAKYLISQVPCLPQRLISFSISYSSFAYRQVISVNHFHFLHCLVQLNKSHSLLSSKVTRLNPHTSDLGAWLGLNPGLCSRHGKVTGVTWLSNTGPLLHCNVLFPTTGLWGQCDRKISTEATCTAMAYSSNFTLYLKLGQPVAQICTRCLGSN